VDVPPVSRPDAAPLSRRIPLALGTPRLWLRYPRESDWRALHAYFGDEASVRYTTRRAFTEAETWRTLAGVAGHWALRGYGPYVLERRDSGAQSGAVLGLCGLWYPNDWPEPEIKWNLVPAARRQGYAAEAARAVRAMAQVHLGWSPISLIDHENAASIALARAVGATHESSLEFRGSTAHVYRHAHAPAAAGALRAARADDAEALAALIVGTIRRHMSYLPDPPPSALLALMRDTYVPDGRTWLLHGPDETQPLAMLSLAGAEDEVLWIRQLYVAADAVNGGLGSRLMAFALDPAQRRGRAVRLWTFQENAGARRFYERLGFLPLRMTDGRDNIERTPDVLYELPA
jgi:RimJ/RimL family protein N-acetyltransferase